jgi:hypothetical protein
MPAYIRDIVYPMDEGTIKTPNPICRRQPTTVLHPRHSPKPGPRGNTGNSWCFYRTHFGSRAKKGENGYIHQENEQAGSVHPHRCSRPHSPLLSPPPPPPLYWHLLHRHVFLTRKELDFSSRHKQQFQFLSRFQCITVHFCCTHVRGVERQDHPDMGILPFYCLLFQ